MESSLVESRILEKIEGIKRRSPDLSTGILSSMYQELKEDFRDIRNFTLALVAFFMGIGATLTQLIVNSYGLYSLLFFAILGLFTDFVGLRDIRIRKRLLSRLADTITEDPMVREKINEELDSSEIAMILMGIFVVVLTIILVLV
ncbi:MAG: hypothetical protein DRO00_07090 [Thermoproteota archaeon]|nr:MAG: hypothetical protein DRO00_07090 [Candidatus Korarchaeota archaeon]